MPPERCGHPPLLEPLPLFHLSLRGCCPTSWETPRFCLLRANGHVSPNLRYPIYVTFSSTTTARVTLRERAGHALISSLLVYTRQKCLTWASCGVCQANALGCKQVTEQWPPWSRGVFLLPRFLVPLTSLFPYPRREGIAPPSKALNAVVLGTQGKTWSSSW